VSSQSGNPAKPSGGRAAVLVLPWLASQDSPRQVRAPLAAGWGRGHAQGLGQQERRVAVAAGPGQFVSFGSWGLAASAPYVS